MGERKLDPHLGWAEFEVLIEQPHSLESDVRFIHLLGKYLRDPRYIRVRGKPLVVVYRPSILTSPAETAARWRSWCRQNGIGLILLYVQSFDLGDPVDYGFFDAAIEFPPNSMKCPRYSGDLTLPIPSSEGSYMIGGFCAIAATIIERLLTSCFAAFALLGQ